ncbi:hypothetical protein COV94_01845, partial [Candidatus Woesearchaeota archaeon CG11_big_fil_rev_8_21_14_0_20_57_5]
RGLGIGFDLDWWEVLPNGSFAFPVSLMPGENEISIDAQDRAGNIAWEVISVIYINNGPLLESVVPVRGLFRSVHNVTAVFRDAGGGIDLAATATRLVDMRSPGQQVPGGSSVTQSPGTLRYLLPSLAPGTYVYTAEPYDTLGNAGQSALSVFTIDPTLPAITLDIPPGLVIRSSNYTVHGRIEGAQALQNLGIMSIGGFFQEVLPAADFTANIWLVEGDNEVYAVGSTPEGRIVRSDIHHITSRIIGPRVTAMDIGDVHMNLTWVIYALASGTVTTPEPLFVTTFNQPFVTFSSTLADENLTLLGMHVPAGAIPSNITATQLANQPLRNGKYTYCISATDSLGNTGDQTCIDFWVEIGPPRIALLSPHLGVSPNATFNIIVETDRQAACRYNLNTNMTYDLMVYNMTAVGGNMHGVMGTGFTGQLYVSCRDRYNYTTNGARFDIIYDTESPVIQEAYARPALVARPTDDQLQTTLVVRTSEPTVCRYSATTEDFWRMNDTFAGQDYDSASTFALASEQVMRGLQNLRHYDWAVQCVDKSGRTSQVVRVPVDVDTTRGLQVTIVSPVDRVVLGNGTVEMRVQVNKEVSSCVYSRDNTSLTLLGTNGMEFARNLSGLSEGEHNLSVECVYQGESAASQSRFSVDRTSPRMRKVETYRTSWDALNFTFCKVDRIYGVWEGEDAESGIASYEYQLVDRTSRVELINWTRTSNGYASLAGLVLQDGHQYSFTVRARDRAGYVSDEMASSTRVMQESRLCSATCTNGVRDQDETDIDCGGSSCDACGVNKTCSTTRDCSGVLECKASEGTRVCAIPRCANGVKDGSESDVDCGGSCTTKCADNRVCEESSDCRSTYCDSGVCRTATCSDGKKNGQETDVDCGGNCRLCVDGKVCAQGQDCESKVCQQSVCQQASCSDTVLNGEESDIDCGGNCGGCEAARRCIDASDCVSGVCQSGKCQGAGDSDGDGMPDDWEDRYAPAVDKTRVDALDDYDKDGLSNIEEMRRGTDPRLSDTDGDGHSDGDEVKAGTSPTNEDDYPRGFPWWMLILFLLLLILLVVLLRRGRKKSGQKGPVTMQQNINFPGGPPGPQQSSGRGMMLPSAGLRQGQMPGAQQPVQGGTGQSGQQQQGQQPTLSPAERQRQMQQELLRQRQRQKYMQMSDVFSAFGPKQDLRKLELREKQKQPGPGSAGAGAAGAQGSAPTDADGFEKLSDLAARVAGAAAAGASGAAGAGAKSSGTQDARSRQSGPSAVDRLSARFGGIKTQGVKVRDVSKDAKKASAIDRLAALRSEGGQGRAGQRQTRAVTSGQSSSVVVPVSVRSGKTTDAKGAPSQQTAMERLAAATEQLAAVSARQAKQTTRLEDRLAKGTAARQKQTKELAQQRMELRKERKDAMSELASVVGKKLDEGLAKHSATPSAKSGAKAPSRQKATPKQKQEQARRRAKLQQEKRAQLGDTLATLAKTHGTKEILDVFEHVLRYLIDTRKVSKKDVSAVVFDLRDKKLVSDKQVSDLFFKLGVDKSAAKKK